MVNDDTIEQYAKDAQTAICRETGLEQYEGDDEVYADALNNFAKNNKSTFIKLKNAICGGDFKLAYRIAHSLRGAAGTIGAKRLADAALSVEKTLSHANDTDPDFATGKVLGEQMMLLEREFGVVFDEIKVSFEEKEELCHHPGIMDRKRMINLIDKLAPFLEAGDTKCLEYLGEIEDIFLSTAEEFKLFITYIEQYDFEQAYETIENIRRFMTP